MFRHFCNTCIGYFITSSQLQNGQRRGMLGNMHNTLICNLFMQYSKEGCKRRVRTDSVGWNVWMEIVVDRYLVTTP